MTAQFQPGQELVAHTRTAFVASQLHEYAEASGDKNPIHLDPTFAQQAGFPSVIVHGMLSMAYLADYLLKNFPETQFRVEHFGSRFKKVTFPGNSLTLKGQVKSVSPEGKISVNLWEENQKDKK